MTVHNLKSKGAAYSPTNLTLVDKSGGTSGIGVGLCTCGQSSPILPTGRRRKAWHAEHKIQMEASAAIDPIVEQLEATGHIEIEDDVVQPPIGSRSNEELEARGFVGEGDALSSLSAEPETDFSDPSFVTQVREWRGNYSIVFVPFTIELAEAYGGLAVKTENVSAMLRKTYITGRRDRLDDFLEKLDGAAEQALLELKVWQKEHAAERRTLTDMKRYVQNREFIASYGQRVAKDL